MPALVGELEVVGRARPAEHHSVESLVVGEGAENLEPEPLAVEAQQRSKIVGGPGDAKDGNRGHAHAMSLGRDGRNRIRPWELAWVPGESSPYGMSIIDRLASARERLSSRGWPLLPLRLLVGFGFASHGLAKLTRGVEAFAAIVAAMHLPAPVATAWATALLELLGGIGLMVGIAVVPLSLAFVGIMLTALFGVHLRYGFSSIRLQALTASGAEFGPVG
jgi:putative oxidoreductase